MMSARLRPISTLLVICALALAAGPATAGTARRLAMGGDTGWLSDADETRHWYASLAGHPDQAYFEFGDVLAGGGGVVPEEAMIGHGGGARLHLAADPRWGVAAFEFQDDRQHGDTDGAFGAGWARHFGSLAVGVGGLFTTYGASEGGSATGYRGEAKYFHRYGLGLRNSLRDGLVVECAGELVNSQAESGGAVHELDYASSWRSFGLRVRAEVRLTDRLTLVPRLEHQRDLRAEYNAQIGGPADVDDRLTRAGLGARIFPRAGLLLVVGGEYREGAARRRARSDDGADFAWTATTRDFYHLRGTVAVETEVQPWLTLRLSTVYVRAEDDQERRYDGTVDLGQLPIREQSTAAAVATPLAVGLGLHHGDWTADLTWVDRAPLSDGLSAAGPLAGDGDGYSALSVAMTF